MQEAISKSGVKTTEDPETQEVREMTEVGQIYLCEICGNKVEVLENGAGALVCCGKPMKLLEKR
jgi:desulfoferrodoxin-like iron-binding protein